MHLNVYGAKREMCESLCLNCVWSDNRAPGRESVSEKYGIPAAPVHPVRERILDFDNVTEVFFDIKTSGLRKTHSFAHFSNFV